MLMLMLMQATRRDDDAMRVVDASPAVNSRAAGGDPRVDRQPVTSHPTSVPDRFERQSRAKTKG